MKYSILLASSILSLLSLSKPLPSTSSSIQLISSNKFDSTFVSSCTTYHGKTPGSEPYYIFYYPIGCTPNHLLETSSAIIPFDWNDGRLIWIQESSLEESNLVLNERMVQLKADKMVLEMEVVENSNNADQQQRFTVDTSTNSNSQNLPLSLLDVLDGGALYQFSNDLQLLEFTSQESNAFTELVAIHSTPLPFPLSSSSSSSDVIKTYSNPVDDKSIQRIIDYSKTLRYSHLISKLLSTLPEMQLKLDVEYLTGESQPGAKEGETWQSRHSMSEGGHKASNWILSQMKSYGLKNCKQTHFLPSFAPLVECTIEGTESNSGTALFSAHMDSRGTFGTGLAGGGDDDASGTAAILSIARHISENGLVFKKKIILALFSGEEQGLLGSHHLAKSLKEANEDIVLMVQADMLGYRKPGEPLQIAFPDIIGLDEAKWLVGNISSIYVPELVVGETPACCSDHQSFEQFGFASSWVFERNGPIADPAYHDSSDISRREGYSYEQIHGITKVLLATLLEVGGGSFE